ncbi:MAG: leishmanolysin-related zinc metalloendopeptidase [Gemmatimonadales bacterium]
MTARTLERVLWSLAVALLSACDLGTGNATDPTSIIVSPPALDLDAIGAADTLAAEVRDGDGRTLTSATVTWSSSDDGVVTITQAGVATAVANGDASITASSGGITRTIAVTVAQRAATLEQQSGDDQSGSAGEPLGEPLVVRVLDRLGHAAAGVLVSFQSSQGGGSLTPAQATTDAQGRAQGAWTLGTDAQETQRARAFASFRVEAAVEFTATALAGAPAEATLVDGDDQTGPFLTTLLAPVVVRVVDAFDNPVAGVSAQFTASPGHGSFLPVTVATDAEGRASSAWTLGSALGAQTASITVGSLPAVSLGAIATAVPDDIEVVGGDGQSGIVGEALADPPAVRVLDAQGDPIASLDVRFTALAGLLEPPAAGSATESVIVRTDVDGIAAVGAWILGTAPGVHELEVAVPGIPDLLITATAQTGPAALLTRVSGDGQRGDAGTPLADPLVVRVSDVYGNPVSAVTVTFAAATQSGSVAPTQDVSDGQGLASTVWTLGSAAGAQFVTASITGASVIFSGGVLGLSGLEIELQFLQPPTTSQQAAFDAAVARWAEAIPGRLTPQAVNAPAGACGPGSPAVNRTIDDLLVIVRIAPIDQAFGTLAQAGVCVARSGGGLPVLARLTVDAADVARLDADGSLHDLLTHELAHAMGFGTLWVSRGLLVNPSLPNSRGVDTYFRGARAIAAFDGLGGSTYAAGQKVPVENREGAVGTRDSHWRLSVLENELMTGFLTSGSSPLSRLTIASLEDLGYEVDESAADPFTIGPFPSPPRIGSPTAGVPLGDDVLLGPIYEVGPDGILHAVPGAITAPASPLSR